MGAPPSACLVQLRTMPGSLGLGSEQLACGLAEASGVG